jgi:hypothetical protein
MRLDFMNYSCLMLLGFCAAALPASGDNWSKIYTLIEKPELQVETSDANIHVSTWDQSTLAARVITTRYRIGEQGIRIEQRSTGNSVQLYVEYPREVCIVWVHMGGQAPAEDLCVDLC